MNANTQLKRTMDEAVYMLEGYAKSISMTKTKFAKGEANAAQTEQDFRKDVASLLERLQELALADDD